MKIASFGFRPVFTANIVKEVNILYGSKAFEETDISVKSKTFKLLS